MTRPPARPPSLFRGAKVWTAGTTGRILIFHCHWGVISMGGTLRNCCHTALRPFFLAVLLAVAWLAWAAGSANAASENPNPLGSLEQATVSLLYKKGSTPPPAIKDVPAPVAAVPSPVSRTAAAVVDVVDPVISQATEVPGTAVNKVAPPLTDAVTGTVDAVTDAVDTVSDTVSTIVSGVDSLAPALPGVQVPSLPIPAVPVPTVPLPTLPVPTVPVPTVPLPTVSVPTVPGTQVPLPEGTIPGRSPVTTASPSGFDAVAEAHAGLEATARSDSQAAKKTEAAPQQARRAVTLLEFLANTQSLRTMAATIGYVVSATPSPANAPEPEQVFRFAALQNQSGSPAAGTGSAGAEASADVAAFWNIRHDARSGLMPDAALILAAGPSFDPGSSPD
ncbi:hypothetical protein [Arthrobacter oryzae]|uniref:hypothetical protein n=1 Tax=Arthrobacter oryzae TaxID=409290 RepID=UPI00285A4E5C|nr:hypothetical protein [Arthrobacter oryzae]MDR6509036.1 hypothetical protein [Arthrobacter oryzae]